MQLPEKALHYVMKALFSIENDILLYKMKRRCDWQKTEAPDWQETKTYWDMVGDAHEINILISYYSYDNSAIASSQEITDAIFHQPLSLLTLFPEALHYCPTRRRMQ